MKDLNRIREIIAQLIRKGWSDNAIAIETALRGGTFDRDLGYLVGKSSLIGIIRELEEKCRDER